MRKDASATHTVDSNPSMRFDQICL